MVLRFGEILELTTMTVTLSFRKPAPVSSVLPHQLCNVNAGC